MPSPSPTTTSAVKLKRRPPLTTLATRLMRPRARGAGSCPGPPRRGRRRGDRDGRCAASPPWRRARRRRAVCVPASGVPFRSVFVAMSSSELQPPLAGGVRERRDPAVVVSPPRSKTTASMPGLAPGRRRARRPSPPGPSCRPPARGRRPPAWTRTRGCAGDVVDDLRDDVPRAGDDQRGRSAVPATFLRSRKWRRGPARAAPAETCPGALRGLRTVATRCSSAITCPSSRPCGGSFSPA